MKKSVIFLAILLWAKLSICQVAVVDFMKVPAGGGDAYLAIEKQWKTFHQNRVNEGKMIAWVLYYVINSGTQSDYNFVTVNVYANMQQALTDTFMDDLKKVFGDKTSDLLKKSLASRNLVYSETFNREMGLDSLQGYKYIMVSQMKTPDMGKYLSMEKTAYLPAHKIAIEAKQLNGWSVWTRMFNEDTSYDAVTVNSFTSAEQMSSMNYGSTLEKLKASNNGDKLYEMFTLFDQTPNIRTIVKTQLWEVIDRTAPKK